VQYIGTFPVEHGRQHGRWRTKRFYIMSEFARSVVAGNGNNRDYAED
jgi:hypothetical protein